MQMKLENIEPATLLGSLLCEAPVKSLAQHCRYVVLMADILNTCCNNIIVNA